MFGTLICLAFAGLSSGALASAGHRLSLGQTSFHPRIGNALGLIPPVPDQGNKNFEPNEGGIYTAVTYHGGPTMTGGVTVHTVFWAPPGYSFQGSPGAGIPSYEGMIQQFFTDVAHDSTGTLGAPCTLAGCNMFTVEPQYAWGTAPGGITSGQNTINYNSVTDTVTDPTLYPKGCTSPEDTKACVTDQEVQKEVDKLVQADPLKPRGLNNLWYVFLPPNVDECISPGVCDTTAFGGYHSLSNLGHGLTVYAVTGDPLIEIGNDDNAFNHPQGNPDAEIAVDIAAHETNEAMSDPTGVGYLDPNGWEIGDKCEFGDQKGNPLGFASNGEPFNQVINSHKYWIQEMWSNNDKGCVQSTTNTSTPLPLPQVNLRQFSSTVSGNTENNTSGIHVTVKVLRASEAGNPVVVATGTGTTAANGSWSAALSGGHAIGDDRDEIQVSYSGTGAPHGETILTGNGGNPFTESGWTGWTAVDEGIALTNHDPAFGGGPSLAIAPCFQVGVLTYTGATGPEPATNYCGTSSGVADVPLTSAVTPGTAVNVSSNDNRAFTGANLPGANAVGGLVNLTVPAGEPDSAPSFPGDFPPFVDTGFPTCTADLGAQGVSCDGLVPGRSYTLKDGSSVTHATADHTGTVAKAMRIKGGDTVSLSNGVRTLTALHVSHLRVDINGDASSVASGTCTPGEYWGGPLSSAPTSALAGEPSALVGGGALTGMVCPVSGKAFGLPTSTIAQTDEHSGGQTVTEVADVVNTSPLDGETMYGSFTALALASDGHSPISLKITRATGGKAVFSSKNVDTPNGVSVKGLKPGAYAALWTVTDANGDSRRVTTRFIEQPGTQGPRGPRGPQGKAGPTPHVHCSLVGHKHRRIVCHVSFAKSANAHGELWMKIAHGSSLAALGHSWLHHGAATVSMRQLRPLGRRSWWMTFVVHIGSQHSARTLRTQLLVI